MDYNDNNYTYNATIAVKLFNVKVLNHTELLGGREHNNEKINLSLSEANLNNSAVNPQCGSLESVPENPLKGQK